MCFYAFFNLCVSIPVCVFMLPVCFGYMCDYVTSVFMLPVCLYYVYVSIPVYVCLYYLFVSVICVFLLPVCLEFTCVC